MQQGRSKTRKDGLRKRRAKRKNVREPTRLKTRKGDPGKIQGNQKVS